MSEALSAKEQARRLVEQMPEHVSWEEILDAVRVRQLVEKGLEQADKGQGLEVNDVRARYGLPPL